MKVYIPIRGVELDQGYSEYQRFIKDFTDYHETSALKLLIQGESEFEFEKIENVKFDVIHIFDDVNGEIKSITDRYIFFNPPKRGISEFLKIDIDFLKKINEESIVYTIESIIERLILIVHLTYATAIDFLDTILLSDENKYIGRISTIVSTIEFAYDHSIKIKWPGILSLKLQDVIGWYATNNLHPNNISKNKLHKAINSFSYQFHNLHDHETSLLFWTMLGIEALLAEGANNIIGQIKKKSSIILGEPVEYKKKLDKLYNYRSRLIHGELDFPAKFSADYENFEEEYWDYSNFATSILLALIRYLIMNNKTEFQFEYRLLK